MMMRLANLIFFLAIAVSSRANADEMRLAVTTSFHNSGLSDVLLPQVKVDLDLDVRLIVVGTGQALKLGKAGDVDAILVHSKTAEEKFITAGYATHRREIMYNDFVLVGPKSDPADVSTTDTISEALAKILATQSLFVSRGDDSGTHRKETSLWKSLKSNPGNFPSSWYRSVGSGMGATLNAASGMNAYVLSDRASWLKFKNKGDLKLLFSGDPALFNQYAYLPLNKDKHQHINHKAAAVLEKWLVGPAAQNLIGRYKIGGEALFVPNAAP